MRIDLHWKRPLFYLLLPIILITALVGILPPFPPLRPLRPSQEQGEPEGQNEDDRS